MLDFIELYNSEYIECLKSLDKTLLIKLFDLLNETKSTNNVYVLGNGGSAASASHWVCDFNKGINYKDSERLKMFSLTDNTPILTALGNDISYDDIFVEQLKNFIEDGDLVIGLSVSGNSQNIVKALDFAQKSNATTFSIIGDFDGKMQRYSNYSLIVPSQNYGVVEDIHMYICHVISQYMSKLNQA